MGEPHTAFRRRLVTSEADLNLMLRSMEGAPCAGLDTESSGPLLLHLRGKKSMVNMYRATLSGLSLAFPDGTSWYIPLLHRTGNLPMDQQYRMFRALRAFDGRIWVHNLKHEILAMRPGGPSSSVRGDVFSDRRERWGCTQVGSWLVGLRGSEKRPFGLKPLAQRYLGMSMSSFDDTAKGMDFSQLPPLEGLDYACEDAEAALLLAQRHVLPLMGPHADWFARVEMPFVFLLRELQDRGMAFDAEGHMRTIEGFLSSLEPLETSWAFEAPPGCGIGSPKALSALYSSGVWDSRGVPMRATGPSTEAEYIRWQLDRCSPGSTGHTLATIKTRHSTLKKLVTTYGSKLVDIAHQYPDMRLHGSFHQTGTATGRLSASYPNLQNIPKRSSEGKRIRESFVAPEGKVLVSADYSQIELRVLAHFCGSGGLYEGYHSGQDVHAATAKSLSELVGIPVSRDQGKTWNFAVIYGAGDKRLAKALSLPLAATKEGSAAHKKLHPEVYGTVQKMQASGRTRGKVRTLGGRERAIGSAEWAQRLSALAADGHRYRSSEEYREAWYRLGKEDRRARNTPIQGGAADIMKLGMLRYKEASRGLDAGPICQIHDDLVVEADESEAKDVSEVLKESLEGAYELRVPLVAEPVLGKRWSDL